MDSLPLLCHCRHAMTLVCEQCRHDKFYVTDGCKLLLKERCLVHMHDGSKFPPGTCPICKGTNQ